MQVDKDVNPGVIGRLRDKDLSLQQMSKISKQTTTKDKNAMSTKFGLKDYYNPMVKLCLDLYRLDITVQFSSHNLPH